MRATYKNTTLPDNEREYEIDGKTFVIKPVYKEETNESLTNILIKLMKSES